MSQDYVSIYTIVRSLPRKLQLRFENLGGYVNGIIEEEGFAKPDREDVQFIQLAALVYTLDNFFRSGTSAAKGASTEFEQHGLRGFQVGSSEFTPFSDATLRGQVLADKLRKMLEGTPLNDHLRQSTSMRDLVVRLLRETRDG